MIERFADPQGGFFDTSDDHERLITRPKNVQDNATPSGGAMAATALFRLTGLTGEGRYAEAAAGGMKQVSGIAGKHPTAFGQWLNAMDYYLGDPLEVAIIGDPKSGDTRELLDVVFEGFRPGVVAAAGEETDISPVPLLSRRPVSTAKPRPTCAGTSCAISPSPAPRTFAASSRAAVYPRLPSPERSGSARAAISAAVSRLDSPGLSEPS